MSTSKVEQLAGEIRFAQVLVGEMNADIKKKYQQINDALSISGNVITKEIESLYKEINSIFNTKSDLEKRIVDGKRRIFIELEI